MMGLDLITSSCFLFVCHKATSSLGAKSHFYSIWSQEKNVFSLDLLLNKRQPGIFVGLETKTNQNLPEVSSNKGGGDDAGSPLHPPSVLVMKQRLKGLKGNCSIFN